MHAPNIKQPKYRKVK